MLGRQSLRGPVFTGNALPDLQLLNDIVSPTIIEAMHIAATQLTCACIPYALIGGLAIGAYGHPRATKDVDFLVGSEAFVTHGGGFITIVPGVPIAVGKIAVDTLSIDPTEDFLRVAIDDAKLVDGVKILPIEALVYMKLKSPRRRDAVDITELIKHGSLSVDLVRVYLALHAESLLDKFDELVKLADSEDD